MNGEARKTEYEVLWPGGPVGVPTVAPTSRPSSLEGKKVAFIWDYMFRGEEMFPAIEKGLMEAYGSMSFVGYDEFGSTFGGNEEAVLEALPARLHELGVDAVVSGVGC